MGMQGGPGDDLKVETKKEEAKKPTTAEVTIDGKKYVVDASLAEAMEKQETKRKAQLDAEREAAAKANRNQGQQHEHKDSAADDEDDASELFSDPKGYLAKAKERLTREIMGEIDAKAQLKEARTKFWSRFYEINDDIKTDHQLIVDAVMNRDYEELIALPVGEQFTELGERARKELLKFAGQKRDSQPRQRTVVEGADTTSRQGSAEGDRPAADEDKVVSIADILKAQREARSQARTKQA